LEALNVIQVPIEWEEVSVAPILKAGKTAIPDTAIASIKKNTVALKGKHTTLPYDGANYSYLCLQALLLPQVGTVARTPLSGC
jgi:hypothetical protein